MYRPWFVLDADEGANDNKVDLKFKRKKRGFSFSWVERALFSARASICYLSAAFTVVQIGVLADDVLCKVVHPVGLSVTDTQQN